VALIVLGGFAVAAASVYEAAQIDGASGFQDLPAHHAAAAVADHRHRDHPAQRRSLALLRHHLHHDAGRAGNASNTLNIYGFRVGFEFFNIGYASALMLTLTAIVFGVVLAFNRLRGAVAW